MLRDVRLFERRPKGEEPPNTVRVIVITLVIIVAFYTLQRIVL